VGVTVDWTTVDWRVCHSWHLYAGHMNSMMHCCMYTIEACRITSLHLSSCLQLWSQQLILAVSWLISKYTALLHTSLYPV